MRLSAFQSLLLSFVIVVLVYSSGLLSVEAQTSRRSGPGSATQSGSGVLFPEPASEIEAFTEPYRDLAIAASEMGTLSVVEVREGDHVTAGSLLARLDNQVLKAALEVSRSSKSVTGPLKSALADYELKENERKKLLELRERDHASQREVERNLMESAVAEARVQTVREDLAIRELEFLRIEAQLEQRQLRSPIDGVVSEIFKEPGEFVSPSDPVVLKVVQLNPLLAVFSVPLAQRTAFRNGQRVQLRLGAEQSDTEGFVEFVSPVADPSNTSVRVKVRLPNPSGLLHAGERVVLVPGRGPADPVSTDSPIAQRN